MKKNYLKTFFVGISVVSFLFFAVTVSAAEWDVPGDFGTIQAAIDHVDVLNGDTIYVAAGTYYENVVIHKSLNLISADNTTTTIDGNNVGNAVTITASDVTVSYFRITNGFGSGKDVFYPEGGIVIDPDGVIVLINYHIGSALTGITIENNIIDENAGNGIYVSSAGDGGATDNIVIRNNHIFNNGVSGNYAGISLTHPNYLLRDQGNIAEWRRPKNILLQENTVYDNSNYGIYVSAGKDIVLRSNTVYRNLKYGIQLAASWNKTDIPCEFTTVEDNEIYDNARNGVKLTSWNQYNTFTGNNIHDNGFNLKSDYYKYGFLFQDGNDNTIQDNTITNNGLGGLYLWGKGDPSWTWYSTTNNTISGNTISDHTGGYGIYIPDDEGYPNSGFLNSIIYCNSIANNLHGLENLDTSQFVDATNNWWGDGSGPSHHTNPGGTGDSVSDYVNYAPWTAGYSSSGFDPPMDKGSVKVKKNRVLALKAELLNTDNASITDYDISAPPVIQVIFQPGVGGEDAVDVTNQALSAGFGTEGNEFEFRNGKWQFNLKTKNYTAAGTYTITMITGNSCEYGIQSVFTAKFVIE